MKSNCHIIFFLWKLNRDVLNTQIIQKTLSKHHPPCEFRKTSTVEYISLQVVFNLNILKFELHYEWTPLQIISQCRGSPWHQVWSEIAGAEIFTISETWQSLEVSYKKGFLENFAIFARKHLCQCLFIGCNFIKKEALARRFFWELCKILRTSFLQNTSGWLLLFYNGYWLYNFIILQLWSSEKSFVGEKNPPCISRILQS